MNVLYCIPHLYNSGGMERVLTQKVNWLAEHTDHTITIVTTELTPEGMPQTYFPLDPRIKVVEMNIDFNADYNKPIWSKWWCHMRRMCAYERALRKYIRANNINLCISLGGKEIAFLRTLPCRQIAEMHFSKDQRQQLIEANHKGFLWLLLGRIRTRQLVNAVRQLDWLVVLTEEDQADWQREGCEHVIVIQNPCYLDGQEMQKASVSSDKNKIVLAVGRLHEQKGFDMLLQAWKPIEKQHPDWTLRIVGEGPQREALEQQIADLGLQHVVLAGRSEKMAEEYNEASLFVLSSRYEGLPLVLIESMWCGLPCIAFDCPRGPKALLRDGRGWIVPNGNVAKLSAQIEYAISHPEEAEQHAKRAQAYAHENYSEAEIMPRWERIILHYIS